MSCSQAVVELRLLSERCILKVRSDKGHVSEMAASEFYTL